MIDGKEIGKKLIQPPSINILVMVLVPDLLLPTLTPPHDPPLWKLAAPCGAQQLSHEIQHPAKNQLARNKLSNHPSSSPCSAWHFSGITGDENGHVRINANHTYDGLKHYQIGNLIKPLHVTNLHPASRRKSFDNDPSTNELVSWLNLIHLSTWVTLSEVPSLSTRLSLSRSSSSV